MLLDVSFHDGCYARLQAELSNPGQVGYSNFHNGAQLASRRLHERRKMGVKGSDVLMKYISVPWNLALRPLFA